jgi:hypothetical protein
MKKILILFLVSTSAILLSAGTLQLAKKGKANAVIVLPDKPNPVARYAASELISHLQMITGAEFRTVDESSYDGKLFPIYLGATRAAETAGL